MNRRQVLYLVGGSITLLGGGVFVLTTPTVPSGMAIQTLKTDTDVLEPIPLADRGFATHYDNYITSISDRREAESKLADTKTVQAFIDNTDFSQSYVLAVQVGGSSDKTIRLRSLEWDGPRLVITVAKMSPLQGHLDHDLLLHSLLIRVSDTKRSLPESTTIEVRDDQFI